MRVMQRHLSPCLSSCLVLCLAHRRGSQLLLGDVSKETLESPPLTYCVTLGLLLHLSELQRMHWKTVPNTVLRMK